MVGAATNAAFFSIKTDSDGNVGAAYPDTWCRAYGGINTDCCYAFQQTPDGGYVLAGYTYNFGVGYLAIRTDSQGDLNCCDIMEDFLPTITDPSVTTSTPSPTVTTPSPGVVIPSLTVADVTPTVNIVCTTPLP